MVGGWHCGAAEDSAGGATLYPAGGALGGEELSEPWDAKVDRSWNLLEGEDDMMALILCMFF